MPSYFHLAPILLAPGSIIEPGNFGRIIRQVGEAHPLFRRDMFYEVFRQQCFPDQPSRLSCLFCFPTFDEAQMYRSHIKGYENSNLYEVDSAEDHPHIADANNGIEHFSLQFFDPNKVSYYWRGWASPADPQAVVMREVLLREAVTVVRRI